MNFYWFGRTDQIGLEQLSDELEDAGFKGVLLPYASRYRNFFIDIARCMKTDQKLKYIVAIRPYIISPQFLSNTIKALNDIDKDRVWINFVSGQISDHEKKHGGIVGDINDYSSAEDRKKYLLNYIPVFSKFYNGYDGKPKICISGMTEEIFSITEKYGDYNFVAYEAYARNSYRYISKPRIISMCPYIRDSVEELDDLMSQKNLPQDIVPTTTEGLVKIINKLKSDGIEDVMFFGHGSEEERYRIIEFVKNNRIYID